MILYDPTNGNVVTTPVGYRPKTCFLMTETGKGVPPVVSQIRGRLSLLLSEVGYSLSDASAVMTGKDFVRKIWAACEHDDHPD